MRSKYLETDLNASFCVSVGEVKFSTCCKTGSGKRLEKVSPGINNKGRRLLNATAAAVTIFVAPGPTDEVAIKICLRRIARA